MFSDTGQSELAILSLEILRTGLNMALVYETIFSPQ